MRQLKNQFYLLYRSQEADGENTWIHRSEEMDTFPMAEFIGHMITLPHRSELRSIDDIFSFLHRDVYERGFCPHVVVDFFKPWPKVIDLTAKFTGKSAFYRRISQKFSTIIDINGFYILLLLYFLCKVLARLNC